MNNKSITSMLQPQTSESDATMVDVYGLKSQAADNMATTHSLLAGLGMIPAVGNIADAVDTMLYLSEGDIGGAGLSALSALPFAGLFAGGFPGSTPAGVATTEEFTGETTAARAVKTIDFD